MKKCKGCGALLQTSNHKFVGYTLDLDKEYCQRCFRLSHYGDITSLSNETIDNDLIMKIYQSYKNDLFVLIVDGFDALNLDHDDLLKIFSDKKVLIVINKIDLLPRSVKEDKLEDLFRKVLNNVDNRNIIGCLLTYKNDFTFKKLFFEVISEQNFKELVFVGRVNAGKTTIINKLLGNNDLTVSAYPGTTISENKLECNGYSIVDTPGLIDHHSFISNLDKAILKNLIPNKCVKPKVFQLYESQAYSIEGLIFVVIEPYKNASITFYIKNELDVHRTKPTNLDNYIDKHFNDANIKLLPLSEKQYHCIKDKTFYIKGLGYIRVKGKCDVKIMIHKDIKIYENEVKI